MGGRARKAKQFAREIDRADYLYVVLVGPSRVWVVVKIYLSFLELSIILLDQRLDALLEGTHVRAHVCVTMAHQAPLRRQERDRAVVSLADGGAVSHAPQP